MTGHRTSPEPGVGDAVIVLDTQECLELLRGAEVGRLAVVVDGLPEIFPINYIVDHGTILFRTAMGTKLAAVTPLKQPVTFEVDGYDPANGEAWSVVAKGLAFEVTAIHELFDAAGLPLFPWQITPKPHFVRIEPDVITGRRFRVASSRVWSNDSKRRASVE